VGVGRAYGFGGPRNGIGIVDIPSEDFLQSPIKFIIQLEATVFQAPVYVRSPEILLLKIPCSLISHVSQITMTYISTPAFGKNNRIITLPEVLIQILFLDYPVREWLSLHDRFVITSYMVANVRAGGPYTLFLNDRYGLVKVLETV
jgi:hypothetical protein